MSKPCSALPPDIAPVRRSETNGSAPNRAGWPGFNAPERRLAERQQSLELPDPVEHDHQLGGVVGLRCQVLDQQEPIAFGGDVEAAATGAEVLVGTREHQTRAAGVDAQLRIDDVPILPGAVDTVAAGILSSLQPQNLRLRRAVRDLETVGRHPRYPLLFDPQTAGGLLASVPAARADACVQALKELGYTETAIIGQVLERSDVPEPIALI